MQHTRLPCPSLRPGVCSNSCPLSQWCHPTISSSVAHFSSCRQSFSASGAFPVSWLFPSGGQSIGASASVPLINIQGLFPLGLTGLIFMQSKGLSRVFSNTTVQKHQFFSDQPSLWSSSCIHTSLVAQTVKNLPAVWKTQVWPLSLEDPLEKGMATHSSVLAWRIPWTEEPGRLQTNSKSWIWLSD